MHELRVSTPQREVLVDVTAKIQKLIADNNWQDGIVALFCPHTTAGLTINEAADPTVANDILATLRRLVPRQGDYQHAEGNSDAHVKASLMGAEVRLLVQAGRLLLGTWQGVFLAEFDGPRTRKIWIQWQGATASKMS
jgi:secondary thiamine-phosphate synthase enzyme